MSFQDYPRGLSVPHSQEEEPLWPVRCPELERGRREGRHPRADGGRRGERR